MLGAQKDGRHAPPVQCSDSDAASSHGTRSKLRTAQFSDAAKAGQFDENEIARRLSDAAHAPSNIPLRTGTVPVTRPSGAPAVTKRIARRM